LPAVSGQLSLAFGHLKYIRRKEGWNFAWNSRRQERLISIMKRKEYPPLFELLFRAAIWTPIALFLTVIFIGSVISTLFLPLSGLLYFYSGDFAVGSIFILGGIISFFVAKYLKRHIWEDPPSLF
jgi:hypothetical protein